MRKSIKIGNLSDIFDVAMKKMVEDNLSIQEIAENIDIDEELLEIFLNSKNNVINDLSRLLQFLRINTYYKDNYFRAYHITDDKTQLKITRIIKPRCSIYFDKSTQNFYKFSMVHKLHNKISNTRKQIIMSEMKGFLENYLRNIV